MPWRSSGKDSMLSLPRARVRSLIGELGSHKRAWQKNKNKNKERNRAFPCGAVVKNPPANAGDMGLSPGLGRSHMPWSN